MKPKIYRKLMHCLIKMEECVDRAIAQLEELEREELENQDPYRHQQFPDNDSHE